MVQLTRIYTRGGDKGKTSLGNGERVLKSALRIEAIGALDEANAAIGVARLHTKGSIDLLLSRVQNELFDVGADLCMPDDAPQKRLAVSPSQVTNLEAQIDHYNAALNPLRSFVLPGGSPASAYLHLARTIVRRAERSLVALCVTTPVSQVLIQYLNRLSDLLFVLGRTCNHQGQNDVLWEPSQTKEKSSAPAVHADASDGDPTRYGDWEKKGRAIDF